MSEELLGAADASVLLIEDDDDDAFLFRKKIEQGIEYAFVETIDVTRADSLSAAVTACEDQAFDAVFLDLGLPDARGQETIEGFTDQNFDVPIIVLTGLKDRKMSLEAIRQGAQDYLVKGESTPQSIVRAMRHAIERKEQERVVRRQRDQIEFFNSILQHDMLNGIQVIQVHAQSLADRLEGQDKADIEEIVGWSDNIVDLTQKVRDILTVVTDGEQTNLKPIAVDRVVAEAVENVEEMREGVTVETEVPPDLEVQADELFVDVVRNLLTNAVEHTRPETVTVSVRARREDGHVELEIEDDGPGVPPETRGSLFEQGEKGNNSTGTGFGLYFVDAMVDSYGGEIRFEDAEPGSRFVIELPAGQVHA